MPRTALTIQNAPGSYDYDGLDLTLAAMDVTNKNDFPATGRELVIVKNDHATLSKQVTISSVADSLGRTKDIVKSIAVGAFAMFGPILQAGFLQADGKIYLEGDDALLKVAVIRLP